MEEHLFVGAATALVTPFDQAGQVNYKILEKLIDYQMSHGCDALLMCAETGENASLSIQEKLSIVSFAARRICKRVPLIAGTGNSGTAEAAKECSALEEAGANILFLLPPPYPCPPRGLYLHYAACAKASKLPFILSSVSLDTALPAEAYERLLKIKTIRAVSEVSGNAEQCIRLKSVYGDHLDIYSGCDAMNAPLLGAGACGCISVLSNLFPHIVHDICTRYFTGDAERSTQLQIQLFPLIEALSCETNPIPVKAAMNLMGRNVGSPRLPLCPAEKQMELDRNSVRTVVCKFGGTSMADQSSTDQVADIVKSDPARQFIVVSAPGRTQGGKKVTDLLMECDKEISETGRCDKTFPQIEERFRPLHGGISDEAFDRLMKDIKEQIESRKSRDFCISRGEYLCAYLFAAKIGFPFIDAAELIAFNRYDGYDSEKTERQCRTRLKNVERAVIPGFYGADETGAVMTFSRGGSDITGSILAQVQKADLYENWTDVDGILNADPHIVPEARIIDAMTYSELRELSYLGACDAPRCPSPNRKSENTAERAEHLSSRSKRHARLFQYT